MAVNVGMQGRDLYLKHTSVDGGTSLICHRVWDGDRFITARLNEAEKANNAQKEGEPRKANVELLTKAQYLAGR